jgi:sigma-B regulation protein RsbQ
VSAERTETAAGSPRLRNNLTELGRDTGPTLVLGHGFATDQTMWHRITPAFADRYRIVLLDQVGSGLSDVTSYRPARHGSLRGYAEDLCEVLDDLDGPPVHYVGHSAGGMIGVLAALARPELFASLALVNASPRYLEDEGYAGGFTRSQVDELLDAMRADFLGWSRSLAPLVLGPDGRPELADELAATFARARSQIAVDFARAIFLSDFRGELSDLPHPTLIVQCVDDPMVPTSVGAFLQANIPHSTLKVLGAFGHFPHLVAPDETVRAISDFLAAQPVR